MKKVYVGHTNQVRLICPKCGFETNKNVFKFKDTPKRLKARCKCGEVFRFTLDFRRYYRKNVRLSGEYSIMGKDEKGEIVIEDISTSGIRFASLEPHHFSRNDIVELKFILDNPEKTQLHPIVRIKWVIDRNVGAQFDDPKSVQTELEFYLKK
jgi:PilZ domain